MKNLIFLYNCFQGKPHLFWEEMTKLLIKNTFYTTFVITPDMLLFLNGVKNFFAQRSWLSKNQFNIKISTGRSNVIVKRQLWLKNFPKCLFSFFPGIILELSDRATYNQVFFFHFNQLQSGDCQKVQAWTSSDPGTPQNTQNMLIVKVYTILLRVLSEDSTLSINKNVRM